MSFKYVGHGMVEAAELAGRVTKDSVFYGSNQSKPALLFRTLGRQGCSSRPVER